MRPSRKGTAKRGSALHKRRRISNAVAAGTYLLGNQAVASTQDGGQGTSEAFGYSAGASGTAATVSVYLNSTTGVQVGLYANRSSKPSNLLATATAASNAPGWVTLPLSTSVPIANGRRYWIAIAASNSSSTITYRDTGSSGSNLDYSGNGVANPYATVNRWNSNPASAYLSGSGSTTPPAPPVNTAAPTVSGTAQQGDALTAADGSWTGTGPISYRYQWQEDGSANIANATSVSYTPSAGDVGHTLDVVVTASNAAGSASSNSSTTSSVTAGSTGGGGGGNHCFGSPGGCGLPDPAYAWNSASAWSSGGGGVGPTNGTSPVPCSALTPSGTVYASTAGETVQNLDISGTIQVSAPNVTIKNVCVTNDGGATLGSQAVKVMNTGTVIEDSTLAGANDSDRSVEMAVTGFGGPVTVKHVYAYNCGECLNTGSWNVSDSYILNNGMYNTGDHLEALYTDGSGGTSITINHSVLLSPPGWDGSGAPNGGQAGVLFGDTNGGSGGACNTHWSITNNLIAGDGVLIYECGNASSVGSAALTFTGNRIARCLGATYSNSQGYTECTDIPTQTGADTNRAGDGNGYYPGGGLKATTLDTYCTAPSTTMTGNVWDDNGENVGC